MTRSTTIMSEGSLSDMDIKIATSSLSMHKIFRARLKFIITFPHILGFPGSSMVKNPPMQEMQETQVRLLCRESPGGGNGNPLQHSCLENPMDRGALWATAHEVTKSQRWVFLLTINYPISQCAKLSVCTDHLLVLVYGDINFHSGPEVTSFQKKNYYE